MKISVIGSGNVATVLSRLIRRSGNEVNEIISRNEITGKALAADNGCSYSANIYSINEKSSFAVFCINDSSLLKIAPQVNYGRTLTVHTAGAVSKHVLKQTSSNYGVLYPLQSLRKEMNEIPEIPFLVDASNEEALILLTDLAHELSPKVQMAGDEERLKMHLAAVIASNFSNHLYTLAADFCSNEQLDFSLLTPLIKETADRTGHFHPRDVQTGPAARGDEETMMLHLSLLAQYPELERIYRLLSDSISRNHPH